MKKRLESRQDVLDVWVNKWATFRLTKVENIQYSSFWEIWQCHIECELYGWVVDVCTILYSPESNFFEVMYPKKKWDRFSDTQSSAKKMQCVTAPDPLTFLLTDLNETTS